MIDFNTLKPGSIVAANYYIYDHVGIVSDKWFDGKPMVISNSARMKNAHEESWDDFSQGMRVRVMGYPSDLPSELVLSNARAKIGAKQYNLITNNCEHFAWEAHGLKHSPQLMRAAVAGMAVTASIALPILSKAMRGR